MRARMKRLTSLFTAAALCLSCIPMSAVYASDQIISAAEVVPEDVDAALEIEDTAAISEAEIPEQVDAAYSDADQALADEELVSETPVVQASKSSQDGEYVGKPTTMQSGPANPRTPKIYYLDLGEKHYPLANARYADYMQGVGILYPGDKVVILPDTDPNPGGYGSHGLPGKILRSSTWDWLELSQGQSYGSLEISKSLTLGAVERHTYVTEVTIINNPVLLNYSGSGNSSTDKWAIDCYAEPNVHDASYWGASTMVWVGMPKYHPVEYSYVNSTSDANEDLSKVEGKIVTGANPEVIFAEDLSCNYNPIDGGATIGPVFTIYHPQIKGYKFDRIDLINEFDADMNYRPTFIEYSEDKSSSKWRFFFNGADDYNWSFDNQVHGSEENPIRLKLQYHEAKTVTLNANGGTVDNMKESVQVYKYRDYYSDSFHLPRYYDPFDTFDPAAHTPVRSGYEFTGWYADKACTKLVTATASGEMQGDFIRYINTNNLFLKAGYENCAENFDMYAGWKKIGATPTPTPKPASGFSDVQNPKHPYYNAIYWAANAGITKGYPDGTFGIDRDCTRGEMMMFLWRYVGKKEPKAVSKSPFKDVPKTHTFYKAILWGSQKGITKGYSDGTFGVNRNVTRGECMMFLWRLKKKPAPKAVVKAPFPDVPKSHVFYNAVLWGYQKKITTGFTTGILKGKFGVNENCTRGQIVTFLYRAR